MADETPKFGREGVNPEVVAKLEAEHPSLDALHIGGFFGSCAKQIGDRCAGREKPIPTPWPDVDGLIGGGWWPGLSMLVGGTGAGKSQFAIQAALHAAEAGTPVLYVGLELDRLGIACRLVGLRAGVQWSDLYLGKPDCTLLGPEGNTTPSETEVAKHRTALEALPFYFEPGDIGGWTPDKLVGMCEAMRAKHPDGPMLVVVDFLQIMGGEKDLRERIGQAAYTGRAMAREHGASVVMVSSTARGNYKTLTGTEKESPALGQGSPTRLVGLGKESGEIEFAADYVLVLAVEEKDPEQRQWPVYLAAAKVRAGLTGWAKLTFNGTQFEAYQRPIKGSY